MRDAIVVKGIVEFLHVSILGNLATPSYDTIELSSKNAFLDLRGTDNRINYRDAYRFVGSPC